MFATDKPPLGEAYLEHIYELENSLGHNGIKGMKWGVRKPEEPGTGRTKGSGLSPRNQKLVTAAAIAGTVAVGAILLSRGNVSVWNSTSNKIVMGGAKMSGKIVGKTGKVLVKSSVKTAKVTGKVGFKTGKIAGKLAGRAGVGAAKGIATATANGGQNFFNNTLKPSGQMTARISSAASHKLTGYGTPWVSEAVKRPMSLNPVALLLNTRADFKRGN